jgi:hypothetical protein
MSNVQELPRRNAESAMQALRQFDIKIADFKAQLDGLASTLATFSARLESIETFISAERIKQLGRGPTARCQ